MYVSTTSDPNLAAWYAEIRSEGHRAETTYVYRIKPTRNFFDVHATLDKFSPKSAFLNEFAALGGIRWDQVKGYWELPRDVLTWPLPPQINYFKNPDYNKALDGCVASGAAHALAGFPQGHPALKQEPWKAFDNEPMDKLKEYASQIMTAVKDEVRWHGHFPLFLWASSIEFSNLQVVDAFEKVSGAFEKACRATSLDLTKTASIEVRKGTSHMMDLIKDMTQVLEDHTFHPMVYMDEAWSRAIQARSFSSQSFYLRDLKMSRKLGQRARLIRSLTESAVQKGAVDPEMAKDATQAVRNFLGFVTKLRSQLQIQRRMKDFEIREAEKAMQQDAEVPSWAEQQLIQISSREGKEAAVRRELQACQAESRGLEAIQIALSQEVTKFSAEIRLARSLIQESVTERKPIPTREGHGEVTSAESLSTQEVESTVSIVLYEVLIELAMLLSKLIISAALGPLGAAVGTASTGASLLRWGRRAMSALNVAERVIKADMVTRGAEKEISKLASLVRKEMKTYNFRTDITGRRRPVETMDDLYQDLSTTPHVTTGTRSPMEEMQKIIEDLDNIKVPTFEPDASSMAELENGVMPELAELPDVPTHDPLDAIPRQAKRKGVALRVGREKPLPPEEQASSKGAGDDESKTWASPESNKTDNFEMVLAGLRVQLRAREGRGKSMTELDFFLQQLDSNATLTALE